LRARLPPNWNGSPKSVNPFIKPLKVFLINPFFSNSSRFSREFNWALIKLFDNKLLVWSWIIGIIGLLSAIYIPSLNNILGTIPLGLNAWAIVIVLAIINIVLIEGVKYYFIARHKTDQ